MTKCCAVQDFYYNTADSLKLGKVVCSRAYFMLRRRFDYPGCVGN